MTRHLILVGFLVDAEDEDAAEQAVSVALEAAQWSGWNEDNPLSDYQVGIVVPSGAAS